MPMTLPEKPAQNQDAAAGKAAPVFGGQWREVLEAAADGRAYTLLNGARLLPLVQGKRPIINDWNNTHLGPADILSGYPQATGFGVVTGPQWPWSDDADEGIEVERPEGATSLICFDFDGKSAGAWAAAQNLPWPTTWMISRLGTDEGGGEMVDGRAKMVFRTTPEQSAELGSWFICKEPTGDGEALEIFHHRGKQLAALGKYGKPGANPQPPGWYCWPEGKTPNTIAELPQEWFELAKAVHKRWKAGRLERGNRARKAFSNGADWNTLPHCPICGRDENLICSEHKPTGSVRCFADGETFHYRKRHGEITPGPETIVKGWNGIQYAFTSERTDGPQGMAMANFVIDRPLATRRRDAAVVYPAAPPEPWTPEPPAAEQTIDVTTDEFVAALPGGVTRETLLERLVQLDYNLAEGRQDVTSPEGRKALNAQVSELLSLAGQLDAQIGRIGVITDEVLNALLQIEVEVLDPETQGNETKKLIGTKADRLTAFTQQAAHKIAKAGWEQARPAVVEREQREARAREEAKVASAIELARSKGDHSIEVLGAALGVGPGNEAKMNDARTAFNNAWDGFIDDHPRAFRYNVLTNQIEIQRGPDAYAPLLEEQVNRLPNVLHRLGYPFLTFPVVFAEVGAVAKANTYNPAADYIRRCAADDSIEPFDLMQLASLTLGTDPADTLTNVMVAKTIIGAAARMLYPGCPQRAMLLLIGEQDGGKSSWVESLMPEATNWVGRLSATVTTNGSSQKIGEATQPHVILEVDEADKVLLSKDAASQKSIISNPTETFRPAYARASAAFPRHCILIGTTNEKNVLRDMTGNTRYWVVDVPHGVPSAEDPNRFVGGVNLDKLRQVRDAMWKTAVLIVEDAVLRTGSAAVAAERRTWNLTKEEYLELAERQLEFNEETVIEAQLSVWLEENYKGPGTCVALSVAFTEAGIYPNAGAVEAHKLTCQRAMVNCGWEAAKGPGSRARIEPGRKSNPRGLWVVRGDKPERLKMLKPAKRGYYQ